ncbi:MAG: flavodoxin family protein [Bacillota bacterium]
MKVLAFAGSPRRSGNTRLLLDAFVDEATRVGHEVEVVNLANRAKWLIAPCLGCDKCVSGECVQKDSMQELYPKLRDADAVVLAAPIYFYGLPAHVKAMIDRCQIFFNLSYRQKQPARTKPGKGFFISCGATKGHRLFEGAVLTVKYWFDALGIEYAGDALFRGVDEEGAILQHPEAFEQVRKFIATISG